ERPSERIKLERADCATTLTPTHHERSRAHCRANVTWLRRSVGLARSRARPPHCHHRTCRVPAQSAACTVGEVLRRGRRAHHWARHATRAPGSHLWVDIPAPWAARSPYS